MSDAGYPDPLPPGEGDDDPDLLTGNIFDLSDKSHGDDVRILKTLLTNLVQNVEKDQPNHAITLFLEGFGTDTFSEFMMMNLEDFDISNTTNYKVGRKTVHVKPMHLRLLGKLWQYVNRLGSEGNPLEQEDVEKLTNQDFTRWNISERNRNNTNTPALGPTAVTTNNVPTVNTNASAVDAFIKNIKKDKFQYDKLTDEAHMEKWFGTLNSQAILHGCENVLDPKYAPRNTEELKLFTAQNNFMYTVFDYTIQIDKGREFITRYRSDRDAQKIYAAMLQYRTTSTAAEINKTKIFDHLSTQQFDEQWSQGAVKFITYWQSQATAYNFQHSPFVSFF